MSDTIEILEDYAEAANIQPTIPADALATELDRAAASLFSLKVKIALIQDTDGWIEFSNNLGHELAQKKRVELFQQQFKASCVVSDLCERAGVEVWI